MILRDDPKTLMCDARGLAQWPHHDVKKWFHHNSTHEIITAPLYSIEHAEFMCNNDFLWNSET